MKILKKTDICEIVDANDDTRYTEFLSKKPQGITMIAEAEDENGVPILKSDAGDFNKWLSLAQPDLKVDTPTAEHLILHHADIWLPLIYLSENITLSIFQELVSRYIYDRLRGALTTDNPRIHVSAEFIDEKTKTQKRFNYEGDAKSFDEKLKALTDNDFYKS